MVNTAFNFEELLSEVFKRDAFVGAAFHKIVVPSSQGHVSFFQYSGRAVLLANKTCLKVKCIASLSKEGSCDLHWRAVAYLSVIGQKVSRRK